MFKSFFAFLILLITLLFAAPSNYKILRLPPGSRVLVDGNITHIWPDAYFIDSICSDANVQARDDSIWTRQDIQLKVWAAWDDTDVYFAVKVISDDVYTLCGGASYSAGCDNLKVNPGGQAAAFYVYSTGDVFRNPSNPWQVDADLHTGTNSYGEGSGLPSYEFSIKRTVLDQFDLRSFQLSVGTEDEDGGKGNSSNECFVAIGVEYLGNKNYWPSQWDNQLYYPTWTLKDSLGPLVKPYPEITLIRQPDVITIRRPQFKWNSLPGETVYTLQVDPAGNFTSPQISVQTSDTFFTALADLPCHLIYWRVLTGQPPVISSVGTFVIQDSTIPVLIPNSPGITAEKRPTLRWHPVTGASAYQLLIADNYFFAGPFVNVTLPDTFYTPLADFPAGFVYWKVRSNLNTNYPPYCNFIILPDTIPFLYSFGGADVSQKRPLFRWWPVSRATSYRIQIDTFWTFQSPEISLDVADTTFMPLADLKSRKYYWRVSCSLNPSVYSGVDSLNVLSVAAESGADEIPAGEAVSASPNPFNPATTIRFANPNHNASLVIVDMSGRMVGNFENLRGRELKWNAADQSSGVYLVKIRTGAGVVSRRICLAK